MDAKHLSSESLAKQHGIRHGFFDRNGGVSIGDYAALNCSPGSADDIKNVTENRRRALQTLELQESTLFGLNQIHSTEVHVVDKQTQGDFFSGDALVSRASGVSLSVLGADCAPILFADSQAGVIAAAHAGWKGAVRGIVEAVVKKMCEQGARRENIHSCVGPCIAQQAYEVQQDFIRQLEQSSAIPAESFLLNIKGKHYFDLPGYIMEQGKRSEILMEDLDVDTYSQPDLFFSYRRNTHENLADYGRQISIIGLV